MALFKAAEKFTEERQESVRLKHRLLDHERTFEAVRERSAEGNETLLKIGQRIAAAREARLPLAPIYKDLREAQLKVSGPLHVFRTIKNNLTRRLEICARPFAVEQMFRLEDETIAVLTQRVHEEVPPEPRRRGSGA